MHSANAGLMILVIMKNTNPGQIITKEEGATALEPHLSTIQDAILGAWQDYQDLPPSERRKHSSTTRANIVHDNMRNRIEEAFDGRKGTRAFMAPGRLFLLAIGDNIVMRFKKLDETLHSSNIPTQQTMDFLRQRDLPGITSSATHLEAGYVLNRLQTEVESAHVTCPRSRKIAWSIPLTADVAEVVSLTGVAAISVDATLDSEAKVKPKAGLEKTEKKGNEPAS